MLLTVSFFFVFKGSTECVHHFSVHFNFSTDSFRSELLLECLCGCNVLWLALYNVHLSSMCFMVSWGRLKLFNEVVFLKCKNVCILKVLVSRRFIFPIMVQSSLPKWFVCICIHQAFFEKFLFIFPVLKTDMFNDGQGLISHVVSMKVKSFY